MVQRNLFPGRNRQADVENRYVDTGGNGRVGQSETAALTYIHYHV